MTNVRRRRQVLGSGSDSLDTRKSCAWSNDWRTAPASRDPFARFGGGAWRRAPDTGRSSARARGSGRRKTTTADGTRRSRRPLLLLLLLILPGVGACVRVCVRRRSSCAIAAGRAMSEAIPIATAAPDQFGARDRRARFSVGLGSRAFFGPIDGRLGGGGARAAPASKNPAPLAPHHAFVFTRECAYEIFFVLLVLQDFSTTCRTINITVPINKN